jgi:hypothetical protein
MKVKGVKFMRLRKLLVIPFAIMLLLFVQGCTNNNNLYNKREKLATDEVKIKISDISNIAKFYPVMVDNIKMEVIAVKASDGTIRTAFNACQVCADSGKGYYVQEGDYLVCQNCGNRFNKDQIGQVRGGCNPVPITNEFKIETEKNITVTKDTIKKALPIFKNWKI